MRSLAALALLCIAAPLGAATFAVSNGGDSGTGSFRWAVEQSNATPGRDDIEWDGALTVRLQSPLPPITDGVTIGTNPLPYWPDNLARPPLLTIDGSGVSGDGLRISADAVIVSSVVVTHFRSGDAMVVEGNDAILNWIEASDAVNGLHVHGLRAGIYGSQLHDNRDAGLWIDSASRDNAIGRWGYGCPPTGDPCDGTPRGNELRANGTGMRVDGEHNTFILTEATGNRVDGAVISGAGNPLDWLIAILNGRNGVTLLAPSTPPLVVSCNGSMPFDVGGDGPSPDEDRTKSRLAVPRITAATRYQTLMNVSGDAHAAPNRRLIVAIYAVAASPVDCGVFRGQIGSSSVTSNGAGDVHFDVNAPNARGEAVYAAVTELDADGNATATSELSAPFSPLTNIEPFADLSVEMTAPTTVVLGEEMTIGTRVTNHGPGASVPYTVSFPLGGGVEYIGNVCTVCQEPPLAPGQTAVIEQRVRVIGRGTVLPYRAEVRGFGLNDPNASNNDATITVAILPAPKRIRAVRH